MRIDQLLLTLHILGVAAWIGGAIAVQLLGARVTRSPHDVVVAQFADDAEAVGKLLFAPASVVVAATGVALVVRSELSWSEPWLLLGLAALVVIGAVGAGYLIPESRRIAELARQPDHDPAELRRRTRRRLVVARLDLSLLVLAVADMVFRVGA